MDGYLDLHSVALYWHNYGSGHRRGSYKDLKYIEAESVLLTYSIPLAELIIDFYDQLKSRTQGYASLDYSFDGYRGLGPGETGYPC